MSRLVPPPLLPQKTRLIELSKRINSFLHQRRDQAAKLGTKYTDPSALITGFRRDEHSTKSDNDEFLRYNQGLTSGPAHGVLNKREVGGEEFSPEMLKFMYDLGEASTPKIKGPEREDIKREISRPMPSSKLKVGPRIVEEREKGVLDGETVKRILMGLEGENVEDKLGGGGGGGIRKKGKLGGLENTVKTDLPIIEYEKVAEEYGLKVEEIKIIHGQLCTPKVLVEKMTGDVKGVWRDTGF